MAYNVGTTVELHGKISASSDTSVTVSCYEMLVGTDYVTFTTPKDITVASTEYSTTALSKSEEAVLDKLANAKGAAVTLTSDELVASASAAVKLNK